MISPTGKALSFRIIVILGARLGSVRHPSLPELDVEVYMVVNWIRHGGRGLQHSLLIIWALFPFWLTVGKPGIRDGIRNTYDIINGVRLEERDHLTSDNVQEKWCLTKLSIFSITSYQRFVAGSFLQSIADIIKLHKPAHQSSSSSLA